MLSERNWRIEGVARMLIGLFVTAFCLILLAASLRSVTGDMSPANRTLMDLIIGALAVQGMALVWTFIFLREEKLSISAAFGIRLTGLPKTLLFGIISGICIVPIAWMLQMISVQLLDALNWNPQSQELVKTFRESTQTSSSPTLLRQQIAFGLSVILLAPIAEEVLFRGILYPTIKRFGFPRLALWSTAIVFALLHQNMAGMLPFIFLGAILVLVYEETDNLLAPILTHSIFNGANFIFMVYEKQINRLLFQT